MDNILRRSNRGLTLTELMIAAILVGIVMLGAVSVDFAIRRGRQNMAESSRMAAELEAAMLQISRDAMATMGDAGAAANNGITWNTGAVQNICFRNIPDNDPNTYTGDQWTCYSRTNASREIFRCTNLAPVAILGPGQSCPAGSQSIMHTTIPFFTVNTTATAWGTRIDHIDFDLNTCADPGQPQHPISNPCLNVESRINPPSLSR